MPYCLQKPSDKSKGKSVQRHEDPSSGIEEFYTDGDEESDTGRARVAYLRLGTHSKEYWTESRQKRSRNVRVATSGPSPME